MSINLFATFQRIAKQNVLAILLVAISLFLLPFGLFLPLMTLSASFSSFEISLLQETRSITQVIYRLYQSGNYFLGLLILIFSVLIPLFKGVIFVYIMTLQNTKRKLRAFAFTRSISKWSMVEVFVVATLVSFLSAKHLKNFDAQVNLGLYFFAGYCLTSLLSVQLFKIKETYQDNSPSNRKVGVRNG